MSSNRRSATEAARARFASQLTSDPSSLSVHSRLCCPIHHNQCSICRDYIAHLLEDPSQADAFAFVIPELLNAWERRLDDVIQSRIDEAYTQGRQDEALVHRPAEPVATPVSRTPSGSTDDGSFVTAPDTPPRLLRPLPLRARISSPPPPLEAEPSYASAEAVPFSLEELAQPDQINRSSRRWKRFVVVASQVDRSLRTEAQSLALDIAGGNVRRTSNSETGNTDTVDPRTTISKQAIIDAFFTVHHRLGGYLQIVC